MRGKSAIAAPHALVEHGERRRAGERFRVLLFQGVGKSREKLGIRRTAVGKLKDRIDKRRYQRLPVAELFLDG